MLREDRSGSRQADGTNLFAGQAFKFVSELLGFRVIGCPTYSPWKHAIRREFFCESSRIDALPRRCTRNCCSIRLTSMPGTLYDPPGTKKKSQARVGLYDRGGRRKHHSRESRQGLYKGAKPHLVALKVVGWRCIEHSQRLVQPFWRNM